MSGKDIKNSKDLVLGSSPLRFGRNYQQWQAFIVRLNHAPVGFKAIHLMPERKLMYEKIGEDLYRLTNGPLVDPNKIVNYLVISHLERLFHEYVRSSIKEGSQVTRMGSSRIQVDNHRFIWISDRHQLEGCSRECVAVFLPGWWYRFSGNLADIEYECRVRFETVLHIDEQLGR